MVKKYLKKQYHLPFPPNDKEIQDSIDEALQRAVEEGIIVDSGERKWSDWTARYEIVWKSKISGH